MKNNHLWQLEHPYYCNEGNYFESGMHTHYKSWEEYFNEWSKFDIDMNLIFRFDWNSDNILTLFYIMQRKGFNRSVSIDVKEEEEPLIFDWLQKHYDRLQEIWTPFSNAEIKNNEDFKERLKNRIQNYEDSIETMNRKLIEVKEIYNKVN